MLSCHVKEMKCYVLNTILHTAVLYSVSIVTYSVTYAHVNMVGDATSLSSPFCVVHLILYSVLHC